MAGLYIHIPFCAQACHYCDFHFSTNLRTRSEIVDAIRTELEIQRHYLAGESLATVYFGGGTPSLLEVAELKTIFSTIHQHFVVESSAEITLEANPDDLTPQRLESFRNLGVNRLSIGIQSFNDEVLKFLHRSHNAQTASQSVVNARREGFDNISVDLIYAIPGQHDQAWTENILQAVDLRPNHISSYSLTIEEKTVFGKWSAKGRLHAVNEETAAIQFETLMNILENKGFEHYEISNFAQPGFRSRHNSNYWREQKYLGVGPSAHSYDGDSRQFNVSNNATYLTTIKTGKIPFEREVLTVEDRINEYLLTGLRTSWGCDAEKIKSEFQYDLLTDQRSYIKSLTDKNLIALDGAVLKLTKTGKLLADKIASDLFLLKK